MTIFQQELPQDRPRPKAKGTERRIRTTYLIFFLAFSFILSLLPTSVSLAAMISSTWNGGPGDWSMPEKWTPAGVPSNYVNFYWVTIPGASSVTLDDLSPAVDGLTLESTAKLSITGKSLEIEDNTGSILSNNGTIELKGTSLASNLRIDGEVLYVGNNGIILYDNNINHGIEGTTATGQKLIIGASAKMLLQGVEGGGRGFLGQNLGTRLRLENSGILEFQKFAELILRAPVDTAWVNNGDIIVATGSNVSFTGKLNQVSADTGLVQVNGILNLVNNAHISEGMITGTGEVNVASATLENVQLPDVDLTCTGSITIKKDILFDSIDFPSGASMYISGDTSVTGNAEWHFPTDSSLVTIRAYEPASLTLYDMHYFFNGKVSIGTSSNPLSLNIGDGLQGVFVENDAEFWLKPGASTIEGFIRAQNSGSAIISNALVTGYVIAGEESSLTLRGTTEVKGQVSTSGTGRIVGTYAKLTDAVVNGDLLLDPQITMSGNTTGVFTVHFNAPPNTATWHKLYIGSAGAHLLASTIMKLSFDSEGTNGLAETGGLLTIDSGATLKLSGKKGIISQITNNGSIEADGMTSGTVTNVANNGTIGIKNGSALAFLSSVSNAGGLITVDKTSRAELKGGTITGGRLQGPAAQKGSRTTADLDTALPLNGAFVGRGATLKGVASAATIIVPEDGSLGIMDSLSNEGQLVVEGSAVDGTVNLISKLTTLGGTGEIVFGGGVIRGPAVKDAQLINDNTIRGQGMVTGNGAYALATTNRSRISADNDALLWLANNVTNQGTVEALGAGGLTISNVVNERTVTVASGSRLNVGNFDNKGTVSVGSGGRLDVARITQQSGSFQVNGELGGGTSVIQSIAVSGGTFSGGSLVQNLSVTGGTLQIANGIGEFEVKYTYSQGPNGVLEVGLGGYSQGVTYDFLKTNTGGSTIASTNLNGTVRVTCVPGFEPKPGDEFTFLQGGGIGGLNGRFANVVNATPYALGFELVYDISTVTLRVSALPTFYVAKDGVCGGNKPCYTSIQPAINAVTSSPAIIKIGEGTYTEAITLDAVKTLTFIGGYNISFSSQAANKTFIKAPKAPKGSLTMQMLTIKP